MSVHTGIQAARRTDSHGHCPQNRLTCANQQPEPVTLIDLPCTPEVPGIRLPWTCAATGRAPATTPTHPILPMSEPLDLASFGHSVATV